MTTPPPGRGFDEGQARKARRLPLLRQVQRVYCDLGKWLCRRFDLTHSERANRVVRAYGGDGRAKKTMPARSKCMSRSVSAAACVLTLATASIAVTPEAEAPLTCVSFQSEVTRTKYGYDHFVRLISSCRMPTRCDVSSSSNPTSIHAVVPARGQRRVLVFKNSPDAHFVPRVTCRVPPKRLPLTH